MTVSVKKVITQKEVVRYEDAEEIVVTLDTETCLALVALFNHVGGSPTGPRRLISPLKAELINSGFWPNEDNYSFTAGGKSIYIDNGDGK